MDKVEIKKDYVHYFKPSLPAEYPGNRKVYRLKEDKFDKFMSLAIKADELSVDLETTSLDFDEVKIVGMGICFEDDRAFYLPFRHIEQPEKNLPEELLKIVYKELLLKKLTIWYNFAYDGHVLEKEGFSVENMNIYDVLNLVFLTDTNWKSNNLKWAMSHFLGWNVIKFEELLGGLQNFSYLDPDDVLVYTGMDVFGPRELKKLLDPILKKNSEFCIKLDNRCVLPLIRVHQEQNIIDKSVLDRVESEIKPEMQNLEREIYDLAGRSFNLGSSEQVGNVLYDLGLDTGIRGKMGKMGTRASSIEKLDHPIAKKIVRYKSISTWQRNFVEPFKKLIDLNRPVRFKYYITGVPTGRWKSGKDVESRSYFAPVNIQAILRTDKKIKYAYWAGEGKGILGWEFRDEKNDYPVAQPESKMNVRRALVAPEGWFWVKADYVGQEMRIPANLSGEPVWIEAFLNGEDLHSRVAGEVGVTRDEAKVINFGILFGMNKWSFMSKFNKSEEYASTFFSKYRNTYKKLFRWIRLVQKDAMRRGVVYTPFGRPRRLLYWSQSINYGVRAFAERSAVNSVVQGGAADIFRIAMVNMYNKIYKIYPDECKFRLAVHDEINSIVKKDRVDLIDKIVDVLTLKRADWPVPMTVSVEIGTSWGDLVEFIKKDGNWIPKREKIK